MKKSKADKEKLKRLFSSMTLEQIMTYTEHFAPVPVVKDTICVGVKSLDHVYITIWGKSFDDIKKSVERYLNVDALL